MVLADSSCRRVTQPKIVNQYGLDGNYCVKYNEEKNTKIIKGKIHNNAHHFSSSQANLEA